MSETELKKIPLSLLPKGWRATVGKEFNVSEATAYGVAAGLRNNPGIFDYLLKMASENKEAQKLREESIKTLLIQ